MSELVVGLEQIQTCWGSPSADSACTGTTRCTPCTAQMMSFSPPSVPGSIKAEKSLAQRPLPCEAAATAAMPMADAPQSPAVGLLLNQLTKQNMTGAFGTSPATKRANGDASQRNPKFRLGAAVIGGDASQRSSPGCKNLGAGLGLGYPSQRNHIPSPLADAGIHLNVHDTSRLVSNSGTFEGITGTCPAVASPASGMQDASHRSLLKSEPASLAVDVHNEALKAWLSGSSVETSPLCGNELAEKLRAAVPESYED